MKFTARQYAEALLNVTEGKTGAALTSAVKDLVEVLASRHELSRWREVARAFDNAWRRKYGASEVTLTTAHEPTENLLEGLVKAFPQASVRHTVNAALMGGAVIQVDDRRLDGSIAGHLSKLHNQLVQG
ncbi:MAG: F0F1 ATP synthase subunit delta [Patescibacteria group bacterium]